MVVGGATAATTAGPEAVIPYWVATTADMGKDTLERTLDHYTKKLDQEAKKKW